MIRQNAGQYARATFGFVGVVAVTALGACSSTDATAAGSATDGGDSDAPLAALGCGDPDPGTLDFLDNMEDGDRQLLGRAGRTGGWYTFRDSTEGSLNPDMDQTFSMESIPKGRCGVSTRAMRVTGSGFSDWGSGFGFGFKTVVTNGVYENGAYDLTAARGVTFWARKGETSIDNVRMGIGDTWSVPQGGHCDVNLKIGDLACWDHFGVTVVLTSQWKRYTYQFGELAQRQFGTPRPALDQSAAYMIEFVMGPSSPVFDIWVDDIALF